MYETEIASTDFDFINLCSHLAYAFSATVVCNSCTAAYVREAFHTSGTETLRGAVPRTARRWQSGGDYDRNHDILGSLLVVLCAGCND